MGLACADLTAVVGWWSAARKVRAMVNVEQQRLREADGQGVPWRRWGPYLSDRQWGTVREDYSVGGDVWSSFTHDQARSRAYRWGEDGLAGMSDDKQCTPGPRISSTRSKKPGPVPVTAPSWNTRSRR